MIPKTLNRVGLFKQIEIMTRRQITILEALQESRQSLNSIKNDLGATEDKTLIDFLKKERRVEYENFKLWASRAKSQLNSYNVNADFKNKVEILLQSKSKDITLNYMM